MDTQTTEEDFGWRLRSLEETLLARSPAKDSELVREKRRQIVEGACGLFFEKGFHPTTIREIAEACGMSMGQLYHYISSKDDILFLAFQQVNWTWKEKVLDNPAIRENPDPLEQLKTFIELTLRNSVEQARLIQFVFTEAKHLGKEHLRAMLGIESTWLIGYWKGLLEKVDKEKLTIDDADFAANLLAYVVDFVALRRWTLKKRSTEENIQLLKRFIFRGLGITAT